MSFILTNHSSSPQTDVNDPLLNSLSATVPRWIDRCALRFGFHVEHHPFLWMSSRHASVAGRPGSSELSPACSVAALAPES